MPKKRKSVTCPKCQHTFILRKKRKTELEKIIEEHRKQAKKTFNELSTAIIRTAFPDFEAKS